MLKKAEAIGLFFFLGWFRSLPLSNMSLIMYVVEAQKLNAKKAIIRVCQEYKFIISEETSSGIKISKFLLQ
jgi:hypothetical protein